MHAVHWPISTRFSATSHVTIRKRLRDYADRIERVAALIAERPYIGTVTRKSNFRRFPVGNYLIVYEVGPDEVIIQYVRHGARRRPWEGER
jgi:plasmid stabilization system protein ParE